MDREVVICRIHYHSIGRMTVNNAFARVFFAISFIACSSVLFAHESSEAIVPPYEMLVHTPSSDASFMADSVRTDSIPQKPKRKLLPEHMSWMERNVWGDDGLMRCTGIASPLTPEVRKSELGLRRTMLTWHQIGGFVTMGALIGSVYFGQATLNELSGGNNFKYYRGLHTDFVTGAIIAYGLTAILSIFSPPPQIIREGEVSTTSIHKILAWIHFTGMIVTPLIGEFLKKFTAYDTMLRFHQYSAYVTTMAFAGALLVVTI